MSRARDTAGIIQYNKISIDSNNAVGIGSSIPDCKLDINGGLRVVGVSTFESNIQIPDNVNLRIGNGDDLQIYHAGTNTHIREIGAGALKIEGANINIDNADGSKRYIDCNDGGSVELYHDNSKKFETTGGGANITGIVTATSFSGTVNSSNLTGALPALDGSALTSLTSSNLSGALPALDGSALTSLTSSNLSGALPALDGSALTNLNIPATFDWRDGSLF
jgi:hypothetical protein